jgi:heme exporter protein D
MLSSALDLISLKVDDEAPFADNDLLELIEGLRELLYKVAVELVELFEGDGESPPPIDIGPFLTLWLSDSSLYLGDLLEGGGSLFFNGGFRSGETVSLMLDGSSFLSATTSTGGVYDFSFGIPVDDSWLGTYTLSSYAETTSAGNITSDAVTFTVSLMPTVIDIEVENDLLSPDESLDVSAVLRDATGSPVIDAECEIVAGAVTVTVRTDENGSISSSIDADDIGFGNHTVQVFYDGVTPYASSASEAVPFRVDIPTTLSLNLFSEKVYRGYYIVGNGSLVANGSDPLEGKVVRMSIDGKVVANLTTSKDGVYTFSLETEGLRMGLHFLRAEFVRENDIWRPAENETLFTIYTTKYTGDYPFWPYIPGWGSLGAPPEVLSDFLFGEYAYFGWLLIIGSIALVVKTVRMRKRAIVRRALVKQQMEQQMGAMSFDEDSDLAGAYADLFENGEPPQEPNERIIWSYNFLIWFLSRKRNIKVRDSMTHREIAKMLKSFGYPEDLVEKATTLFEMARYSGATMTESETNTMGMTIERLKSTVLGGRGYAA